ncbi:MAG: glycosyltransferase family 4 protein [bacterium JZ-2024 1]
MHLVFLTERLLRGFGADRVVYEWAKYASAHGHRCTIWCIETDGSFPPFPGLEIRQVSIARPKLYPYYELWALRRLRFILRSSAPADSWIVATIPFYPYSRWCSPALVCDFGFPSTAGMPFFTRFNFAYMKWVQYYLHFPPARKIACISHYVRDCLGENLRKKAEVIYPGREHISPAESYPIRAKREIMPEEVVLLYVGRLNPYAQPYKGVLFLRKIFLSLVKEVSVPLRLVLAGYGTEKDAKLLSGPGILVEPNISHTDLISWYAACDIYVSASQWEGFNLPFLEAQSLGKPVVGFRVGGHRESVYDGQTGFLASNEKEFYNHLLQLVQYPDLRWKMGEEAFHFAQKFSWKYAGEKFLQMIQSL